MANTNTITIRTSLDTGGFQTGGQRSNNIFDKMARDAEKAATRIEKAFARAFGKSGGNARAQQAEREFERIARAAERTANQQTRAFEKSAKERERAERSNARAVEALQRQRSAALLAQWKAEERAHAQTERAKVRQNAQAMRQIAAQERAAASQSRANWASTFAFLKTGLLATVAGAGILLGGLTVSISRAMSMDALVRGLIAISGSAEEANKQLVRLREVAKAPGLGFREAIQGTIRLQAVGLAADTAERALKAFGNAVALTGGGKAELDRITVQLGQLSAKGKILSQDLRPIIEAAPAVGRALKLAFGTVDSEELQKLGLTTEQFLNKLLTQLEKLPQVTNSSKNAWENFTDSLDIALVTLGKPFLDPLTKALDHLAPMMQKFAEDTGALFTMIGDDAVKLWANLPQSTRDAFAQMVDLVRGQGQIIVNWFKTNYPLIQEAVSNVLNQIARFWHSHGGEIQAFVQNYLTGVLEIVRSILLVLAGDWDKAWASLAKIIRTQYGALQAAVVFLVRMAFEAVVAQKDLLKKAGVSLGEALVDGAVQGMKSKTSGLMAAIAGVFNPAAALAHQLWQVKSPSKVFERIGEAAGEGLVRGLTTSKAWVMQSVTEMMDLTRLLIPEEPGSGKKLKAAREADKKQRPGLNLLEKLYGDIDQLAPAEQKTKALSAAAELAKVKYADLSVEVRKAIGDAAAYYDRQKALIDVGELFAKTIDDAREELLKLKHPLGENATELEKFDLALILATEKSPLFAEGLAKSRLELEKVRAALIAVDSARIQQKRQATALDMGADLEKLQKDIRSDAEAESTKRSKDYADIIGDLNGKLNKHNDLTEVQITLQRLQEAGLGDLTDARARDALAIAAQIDRESELEKVRGRIADFASDVGDIFGRAVEEWDGSFKGFFKSVAQGFGDLLRRMIADLVQSAIYSRLKSFLEGIFKVGVGQSGGGSGGLFGAASNVIGSFLRPGATGAGVTGGFAGGTGAGQFLGAAAGRITSGAAAQASALASAFSGAGSVAGPTSFTGSAMASQGISSALGGAAGAKAAALSGPLGSLGASFAPLLPILGLSLGSMVGKGSRTSSILGGAGGLLLGGAGAVGLLGGAGAAIFSTGGALAGLGGAAALLTNPFTIAAGAAILIGSYFLGKAKQRKKDEAARDGMKNDTMTQLDALLKAAQRGQIDPDSAKSQALALIQAYYQQVAQIKTKSVRQSAENFRPFFNAKVAAIEAAAKKSAVAQEFSARFSPTYALGGRYEPVGLIAGRYDGADDVNARLSRGETVLTPTHVARLGGAPAMSQAGVPGYGGTPQNTSGAYANGGISNQQQQSNGPPVFILAMTDAHRRELARQLPGAEIVELVYEDQVRTGGGKLLGVMVQNLRRSSS